MCLLHEKNKFLLSPSSSQMQLSQICFCPSLINETLLRYSPISFFFLKMLRSAEITNSNINSFLFRKLDLDLCVLIQLLALKSGIDHKIPSHISRSVFQEWKSNIISLTWRAGRSTLL